MPVNPDGREFQEEREYNRRPPADPPKAPEPKPDTDKDK